MVINKCSRFIRIIRQKKKGLDQNFEVLQIGAHVSVRTLRANERDDIRWLRVRRSFRREPIFARFNWKPRGRIMQPDQRRFYDGDENVGVFFFVVVFFFNSRLCDLSTDSS